MSAIPIQKCRVCSNPHLIDVLHLGEQTLTGVFPDSPDFPVLSGPLNLVRCSPDTVDCCGLLQLKHSYPSDLMYGDNYGYRSGLNVTMVRHLETKAAALIQLANPSPGSLLVDIGCNDGTLLKAYSPVFRRAGFDPVAKKFLHFYPEDIAVATEFFSKNAWERRWGNEKAAIITSIAMFYDLESPLEFVSDISTCLLPDGIWHFEQSYMPLMISQLAYDTVCHEHVEYYALRQIDWILRQVGMKIIDLQASYVNGGSLAVTAAKESSKHKRADDIVEKFLNDEREAGFETMKPFESFRKRTFQHREALVSLVDTMIKEGKSVMGYGASTKGNVLLQFCGFTPRQIPFIAEVNEEKFGRFTPGSGIPILSEENVHKMRPDILLVLPWHFRENLIEREAPFVSRGGRLLFPLPEIQFHPD